MAAQDRSSQGYRARPGYIVREIAGEYLLIPVQMQNDGGSQIVVLNETGKFLWEQLSAERTAEELTQSLVEEYQVTGEEARADIQEFLEKLSGYKLLDETGGE